MSFPNMIELYKELEGPLGEKAAKALVAALESLNPEAEKALLDQTRGLRSEVSRVEQRIEELGERFEVMLEDLQALREGQRRILIFIVIALVLLLLGLVALGLWSGPDPLSPFEEIR